MNSEKQNKLFEKYSEIFSDRNLPKTQTLMCWGIACGDGWYDLIDRLCGDIVLYCKENDLKQPKAVQVKEKFGGLRFYIHGGDDEILKMISKAESESYKICSKTGKSIIE